MNDTRFARLRTDPRFRRPKKNKQKVVVDERFKAIFEDDDRGKKSSKKKKSKGGRVDKYGRRTSVTHEKDNLRRFYRLEGEDVEKEPPEHGVDRNEEPPAIVDYARGQVLLESSDEEDQDDENAREDQDQESDADDEDAGQVVLGRHASKPIPVLPGEEDEYLEVDLNEDEDAYADLDAQASAYTEEYAHATRDEEESEQTGIKTSRIAVVNLDWDHVRASHLYKIFSSLVSPTAPSASIAVSASTTTNSGDRNGNEKASNAAKVVRGKVLSVRVYPSEFGKERLRKEEVEGPPKEIFKKSRRDDILGSLIQEDEGDPFDEKVLRKYQLERLRYYYAIVSCDTVDAAAHIVSELDGTELERSANVFDLSFVPDDMTFDNEFRDEATPATESSNTSYKPLDFSTDALRHSKVTLKWDEDDPERNKVTRRALSRKEIEEGDYRAYIASSSSEDEDQGDVGDKDAKSKAERDKLRQLLLGVGGTENLQDNANPFDNDEDKGADGEIEITFMPGLSEANAKEGDETMIEKYKRKQKEKRLARKKEKKEKMGEQKEKEDRKTKAVEDDFFAPGSSSENEEDIDARKKSRKKASKRVEDESRKEKRPATEAELELLAAPDDMSASRNHFDMKAILKAEKAKGRKRGKKDKKQGVEDEDEIQENFQIDVKDERFKALHEDHTFAIDPSNPLFKKTKSMAALLEERSKRQSGKAEPVERRFSELSKTIDSFGTTQSLQSLVESVKRKSSHVDGKGMGKRRKV